MSKQDFNIYKSVYISVLVKMISFIMNWIFIYIIFIKEPIAIVLITIGGLLYYIVAINYEYIKILDDEVYYNRGIIMKKSLRIYKERLKSMDVSKNILGRIFSFSTLKIETAVMGSAQDTTIKIYLVDSKIEKIRNELFYNDKNICTLNKEQEEESSYKVNISNKDLFLSGLTSAGMFIVICAGFQGLLFLTEIGQSSIIDSTVASITSIVKNLNIGFVVLIFVVSFILLNITVGVLYIIKFYDFKLIINEKKINISYGFFNKREFAFDKSDIKAIVVNSNPLRQLFGYSEIKLDVKGYSGFGEASIVLTPFIKANKVNIFINKFVPDFLIDGELQRFEKCKGIFLIKPVIVNFFISLGLIVIFKNKLWFFYNICSLINICGRLLIIKNTGLIYDNKLIKGITGGFYKQEKIFKLRSIQSIKAKETVYLRRNKIATLNIYYYSEMGGGISLRHLSKENVFKISNNLVISCKKQKNLATIYDK